MIRKGRGKTRDPSTDVKGRKHVKNKNTQIILNPSDAVAQHMHRFPMDLYYHGPECEKVRERKRGLKNTHTGKP